jgi:hypothetical protein
MTPRLHSVSFLAVGLALVCGSGLAAQDALMQLGLTETAARKFVIDEIKSPAEGRRSEIATAGTRAFLKLPPSVRGGAATRLFAWAKAYVSSPAFAAAYAGIRRDRLPTAKQYELTAEQQAKKTVDDQLAELTRARQAAAILAAEDRAAFLASTAEAEKNLKNPEYVRQLQARLEAERQAESGSDTTLAARVEQETPADPRKLFARRLRGFLDATAAVDFKTRTISLTGGADGIEFVDPIVRTKAWMWHEAAIVGPEATAAARAAAEAWLKEIER